MLNDMNPIVLALETQHGDKLVARMVRLEELVVVPAGPLLRVLEFNPDGVRLTWGAIERLRTKALHVLDRLTRQLEESPYACFDVTLATRATDVASVALAANVAVETPVILVEAFVPALAGAWRSLLDESRLSIKTRAVRRRRPLAPATDAEHALAAILRERPGALLDSESAGRGISGNLAHKSPKVPAARARKRRAIYGLWDGANAYLYPAFQFAADGKPLPAAERLANALVTAAPAAAWWFYPNKDLDGLSPADAFPNDPDQVIALATQEALDVNTK